VGQSQTDIAHALDKVPASIFDLIRKRGGTRPPSGLSFDPDAAGSR